MYTYASKTIFLDKNYHGILGSYKKQYYWIDDNDIVGRNNYKNCS